MFVVLTYDVSKKRNDKMMKLCLRYLNHVQESVFEGEIKEGQLRELKDSIRGIIDVDSDSCIIYNIGNTKYCKKERIGFNISVNDVLFTSK